MGGKTSLNFERGTFELRTCETKVKAELRGNPAWEKNGNTYLTTEIGAAKQWRGYASEKTERLFQKVFQAHYRIEAELPPYLDPHQVDGVKWILSRKRSYLAHAPGAGKTAQAVTAAVLCSPRKNVPRLFIVPPSLTKNWEREILKFTEGFGFWPSIGIIPTSPKKELAPWRSEFLICPDSMLAKPWVAEALRKIPFQFIAVDEASRFKERFAQRSLAFYGGRDGDGNQFTPLFRNAKHVVFLDGSPMPNRPAELWAPTFALHPEAIDCRNWDSFGYRYCGARPNSHGTWEYLFSSNEDELHQKLTADFMHVVTEAEVNHPERRRSMVVLNADVRSREIKEWEAKNLKGLRTAGAISEDLSQGEAARFRKELGIRKVPYVAQYVRERLETKNESILLFAWHREVVDGLFSELEKFDPGKIYGGIADRLREAFIEDFQSGARRLLILNIAAAGRGHNLYRADRVVFGEFSWTDETNKQAEKRASRRGSKRKFVRCDYLVAPSSMDEIVLRSIFSKQRRVERVIG